MAARPVAFFAFEEDAELGFENAIGILI